MTSVESSGMPVIIGFIIAAVVIIGAVLFVVLRGKKNSSAMPKDTSSSGQSQSYSSSNGYVRREGKEVLAFYNNDLGFGETPEEIKKLVDKLASITGLPKNSETYPSDEKTLQNTAIALSTAAKELFGFDLDLKSDQENLFDRFIDTCLMPKGVRELLVEDPMAVELSEEQQNQIHSQMANRRLPDEPLLYYALGAYWGQWLVEHKEAEWNLYDPLRPYQHFMDAVTGFGTAFLFPFSQAVKKLQDPLGDNLGFKSKILDDRDYFTPFPLLASFADQGQVQNDLIGPLGCQAMAAMENEDYETAHALFEEALNDVDYGDSSFLYYFAQSNAWAMDRPEVAFGKLMVLLEKHPNNTLVMHNMAILYTMADPENKEAWQEGENLLRRAVELKPSYSRARLTLASVLHETGRTDEAMQQLKYVFAHDRNEQMRAEATQAAQEYGAKLD